MAFDVNKFMSARLVPRTESVPVPDLKDFFEGKDKPVWTVRGITGNELGRANEAAARNKNIAAILEGLVSGKNADKVNSVRKLLGTGEGDVPDDIAKRIEMLKIGSVDPVCDLDLALKMCKAFPVEFFQLTNKITNLTGQGHEPGKAPPSGKTKK